jgi:hypothetical protein
VLAGSYDGGVARPLFVLGGRGGACFVGQHDRDGVAHFVHHAPARVVEEIWLLNVEKFLVVNWVFEQREEETVECHLLLPFNHGDDLVDSGLARFLVLGFDVQSKEWFGI